jgi:Tol biopolymer transport system component
VKSRTLTWFTAITFAAFLVYAMLTARPVHATFPGTNGQIAFAQLTAAGPANVFIANPDGSNLQLVPLPTDDPDEMDGVPIWSPDGSTLLISHTIRVFPCSVNCLFQPATVDPSGSNFNQLVPPNPPGASSVLMDCEAWFPGGSRILCGFSANPDAGVFSINASNGGDVGIRLTTNPDSAIGGMDFPTDMSPDGTRFVFLREKPARGPSSTPLPDAQVALFVENIDGTGLRQITPFFLSESSLFGPFAKWSPDGLKIITNMSNGAGGTANGLFIVHPNGGGMARINLQVGTQQYSAFQPAWSPDGTRIIFCMFANGGEGIYTATPDGSNVKQVTFIPNSNLGPNFANVFTGPNWGTHPLQ